MVENTANSWCSRTIPVIAETKSTSPTDIHGKQDFSNSQILTCLFILNCLLLCTLGHKKYLIAKENEKYSLHDNVRFEMLLDSNNFVMWVIKD